MPAPAVAYGVAMTTDEQSQVLVAGDKVYLSQDYGRTFMPVLDRRVDAVAYDPRNDRLAYAARGARAAALRRRRRDLARLIIYR